MDLFQSCSPATITGFVVAVVVNSFDSHPRRRLAHIFKEGFEAIAPAVAHFDAATAVIREVLTFWVVAAVNHARPNHVNPRVHSFACMSMFEPNLAIEGGSFASATGGMFVVQMADLNDGHRSAVALAKPSRLSALRHLKEFENGQSPEAQTGDILEGRHDGFSRKLLRLGAARCATSASSRNHHSIFHVKQEML